MKINLNKSFKYTLIISLAMLLFFNFQLNAQIKEEVAVTIRKQTVNVQNIEKKNESAVPPVISDAAKETINYNIEDIAPDNNFQPSPLPPSKLNNLPKEKLYQNYIEAGYGNLSHIWVDAYVNYEIDSSKRVGLRVNNNGTKGLKNYPYNVNTDYRKTYGELFFESPLKGGKLHTDLNFGQNKYNLFGSSFPNIYFNDSLKANVEQNINKFGGKLSYETFVSKFFNRASLNISSLNDKFDSKEFDIDFKAALDKMGYEADIFNNTFDLGGELPFHLAYTSSKFQQGLEQEYNYFDIGASPTAKLEGDAFNFKIGVKLDYLSANVDDYGGFYFFPKFEMEYLDLEQFKVFAGVDGGLEMNSYQSLLQENRYLFPDQTLAPTVKKYDFYGGIKGSLKQFSYDVKVSYSKNDHILFYQKKEDSLISSEKAFDKFNTLQAVYDNGSIFGVTLGLQYVRIENLNLGLMVKYNGYTLENFDKIWNKPNLTAQINAGYKFLNDKLSLGGQVFFVGSRVTNDFSITNDGTNDIVNQVETDLKPYFDLNISGDYEIKPFLNVFLKGINLLNAQNELYVHYPMQGTQVLGGLLFKF